MCARTIVKVAVDKVVYSIDKLYSYLVPEDLLEIIKPGVKVLVPFGCGNKQKQAIVFEIENSLNFENLKEISAVLEEAPLLNEEMLKLVLFMKKRYFCTYFDAIRVMLPSGTNVRLNDLYFFDVNAEVDFEKADLDENQKSIANYIKSFKNGVKKANLFKKFGKNVDHSLEKLVESGIVKKIECVSRQTKDAKIRKANLLKNIDLEKIKLTVAQKEVVKFLSERQNGATVKEIKYFTGINRGVVDTLVKKNILEYIESEIYRDPYKSVEFEIDDAEIELTEEQKAAHASLLDLYEKHEYSVSLLYGVTGSGKTSVFMKLIDDVHNDGLGIIVMVPEIALTPQMVNLFKCRYGQNVAVFHSGLSDGERLDEFKRVKKNEANIVIGTRSAVFAPVKHLGLIVIDEEQEYTYKSDKTPRYHARDIAKFRSFYNKSLLVLSSATPSVESFYLASSGKYKLNKLGSRYNGAKLPEVSVIDMNEERANGNFSNFSAFLLQELKENLKKGHQSILLLNRRGYNTLVSCRNCHEVVFCPHCSVSLIYHSANNLLMCHYCGYSVKIPEKCPKCGGAQIKYSGIGIQKIEEELNEIFPECKILRMDADTNIEKFSYKKKWDAFLKKEYQIMLGTQMVAKGLNFPNVTLVGVVSSDHMLYSGNYKSYERTFALLTQVIGRSGRGKTPGKAVIQTFLPEHHIISLAKNQVYEEFYKGEVEIRKAMIYPPFSSIYVIGFVGLIEGTVEAVAKNFLSEFIKLVKTKYNKISMKVFGPAPAEIVKLENKYRYRIIIKCRGGKEFRELVSSLLIKFGRKRENKGVSVFVDVNPDTIM